MNAPVILLITSAGCWVLFFVCVMLYPESNNSDDLGLFGVLGVVALIGACLFLGVGIGVLIQDNLRGAPCWPSRCFTSGLPR